MTKQRFQQHHQRVAEYFNTLAAKHGYQYRANDYGQEISQRTKYQVMSEIGNLDGRSILDVGCGLAQFYDYLTREQGLQVRYVGIDISPRIVRLALEHHPGLDIRLGDVLNTPLDGPFEYVFANGLFYIDYNHTFVQALIHKVYELCGDGACISTTSSYAPVKHEGEHYSDPAAFFRLCKKLTPRVVLRHDYTAHDFTAYLYRGPFPY